MRQREISRPIKSKSGNFDDFMTRIHRNAFLSLLIAVAAACVLPFTHADADEGTTATLCSPACLLNGKSSLEMGDYEKALVFLTAAHEEMPFLDDYILFWRAKAFEGKAEFGKALSDIRTVKTSFPDSPIIKNVRMREIELAEKTGEPDIEGLFRKFLSDYPSDSKAKFAYATYLKSSGSKDRAKALFKEIYLTVSPFSKSAGEELFPSDLGAADILKKGRSLNNAWLFPESEKQFRDALKRHDAKPFRRELTEGLAYSLFRQKKYREAAGYYADCDDRFWKAKSLFRAGDMEHFESELNGLSRQNDKRVAALLLAYGSKKRRAGDIDGALSIYKNVLSRFQSAKEDALWHEGWTYYRTGNYGKAMDIFSSMHKAYGDSRYLYWKNRCIEQSGAAEPIQTLSLIPNDRNNNFYMFMASARKGSSVPPFEKSFSGRCSNYHLPKRVETLESLGLKTEARAEVASMTGRNLPDQDLACLSAYLRNMKDFKTSISIIARLAYREDYHELYYPPAYPDIVEEAARANEIDPLLVLSIMREESRFASDARSVAGALGLMQLMPQTASKISRHAKVSMGRPDDLYDARINVLIGTYYLKSLINHFDSVPLAVAAYNAGEEAVKGWMSAGKYSSPDEFIEDIPYDETRNYVKKVLTSYFEYIRQSGRSEAPKIF
ncbi:MAG TPA: transglycosylase SLT domain-containing protein [Dissulfurispiraceae bacterium]|nr:transglycosylase SLT domain-containing protein [Dissulfurispiraceae bacterium]